MTQQRSPRRSIAGQISEVEQTIAERRSTAKTPQSEYRLHSLDSVLATLVWLQRNEAEIRRLFSPQDA